MPAAVTSDWRQALRLLPRADLLVIRRGLADDDGRLCRFCTTVPVAVSANLNRPCEGCCLLVYPYLVSHPEATAGAVSLELQRLAAGGWLGPLVRLWDSDSIPRHRLFALLLGEVEAALAEGAA